MFIIKQHTVSKFTNFKSSSSSVFRPYMNRDAQSWRQPSPITFLSLQEVFQTAPCLQYLRSGQAQRILYIPQIHKMASNPPTLQQHVWLLPSNSNAMHELCFQLHATPLGSLTIHVAINCCSHNLSASVSSMSKSCSQSSSLLSGTQQNNQVNIHNMFMYENSSACPCITLFHICEQKFN